VEFQPQHRTAPLADTAHVCRAALLDATAIWPPVAHGGAGDWAYVASPQHVIAPCADSAHVCI